MNFDSVHTVWLDLDDTLIDFTAIAADALGTMWHTEQVLRSHFPTPEVWAEIYEKHNMQLWAQYSRGEITRQYLRAERFSRPLIEGGVSSEEAAELSRRFDTIYLDLLARGKTLMPGAMELLRSLRRHHFTIGILSNGFKEVQFRKIRTAGLEPYIDIVVLSDDIDINKPDPRLYGYAMQRVGDTDPCRHLMIGDNPDTDIAGAIAAGWPAIWYDTGRLHSQPPVGAARVTALSEIPPLLNLLKK